MNPELSDKEAAAYYNVRFQTNRILGLVLIVIAVLFLGSPVLSGLIFLFSSIIMFQTAHYASRRNRFEMLSGESGKKK